MKIKKFIACLLALNICTFYTPLSSTYTYSKNKPYISVYADEDTIYTDNNDSNIKFKINKNSITITNCSIVNNTVTIPPYVTTTDNKNNQKIFPVTHISLEALENKSNIEILEIPEYTSIPTKCFINCKNLNTVTFYSHTFEQSDAEDSPENILYSTLQQTKHIC